MGLPKRRNAYALTDFASQAAGVLLDKDRGMQRAFGELADMATSTQPLVRQLAEEELRNLPERMVRYAATDAWATKAAYEWLLESGRLERLEG